MNLLSKLFATKPKEKNSNLNWIQLSNINQLDDIDKASEDEPLIIFKHSTSCNISKFVLNKFEKEFQKENLKTKSYYLDLLSHRDISNKIAEKFEITHQSPQALLIFKKKAIYNASHENISVKNIAEKVNLIFSA